MNAFDELSRLAQEGGLYDMVMLDPAAFHEEQGGHRRAIRGYKEINLRGIKLTKPGGYLVTSSCSQHIGMELFKEVVLNGGGRRKVFAAGGGEVTGEGPYRLLSMPETDYLKFLIFRVV